MTENTVEEQLEDVGDVAEGIGTGLSAAAGLIEVAFPALNKAATAMDAIGTAFGAVGGSAGSTDKSVASALASAAGSIGGSALLGALATTGMAALSGYP